MKRLIITAICATGMIGGAEGSVTYKDICANKSYAVLGKKRTVVGSRDLLACINMGILEVLSRITNEETGIIDTEKLAFPEPDLK